MSSDQYINVMPISVLIDKVSVICKQCGVKRLDLFGSFATGNATPRSDIDFAVGSPREVLQSAFTNGLIHDDVWLQMLKTRNLLAHDYDRKIAEEKFDKIISDYYNAFKELKDTLIKYYNSTLSMDSFS